MMCLSNDTWSLTRLSFYIQNSADTIKSSFQNSSATPHDRMVRWNSNNHLCHILNVDGSCSGIPTRAGYGGIIRNSAGLYLSCFSGFIADSTDILLAELTAIHRGFSIASDMGVNEMACYSDSLLSINLITGQASKYHAYAVLIQDIKDLLSSHNFSIQHCLREGNQCADFMAKFGASSNNVCFIHPSPPQDLHVLLRNDAIGTCFPRA
uniref:Ribonuclease H n=1 Tax=Medicago truncatula TaxID=3880 RepID=Q2HUI8_MEDTR|nr:Ribonuclease H [Medicago truncatula]